MPTPKMTQKQVQQARDAVAKHGTLAAAARALKLPKSTLQHRLSTTDVAPTRTAGRSLDEFRSQYDKETIVPAKVRAALRELGSGWAYEIEFVKLAGVALADLANFRDMFADHVVAVQRSGKRAWAGTKATADKMREMLRG